MSTWIRRSAGTAARNGSTTHTVTFAAAASGNLLVAVASGGVTSAFSAGWTKQKSALDATELVVATKTATSGETSLTLTHNASNYPLQWVVYEFAAGSTFGVSSSATNVNVATAWTALTSIPSGSSVFAVTDWSVGSAVTAITTTWTNPATKDLDAFTAYAVTDGAYMTVAVADGVTGGTLTPSSSMDVSGTAAGTSGRLIFSVLPNSGGGNVTPTADAGPDQTVQATYTSAGVAGPTVTLTGAASSDPDGTIASYAWTQTSGTAVTLSGTGATRTFTAPRFGGTLVFGLTVTDNGGATSSQKTVTVNVTSVGYGYVRVAGAWVKRPAFVRRSGAWDSTPSIPAGSYTTTYGATY